MKSCPSLHSYKEQWNSLKKSLVSLYSPLTKHHFGIGHVCKFFKFIWAVAFSTSIFVFKLAMCYSFPFIKLGMVIKNQLNNNYLVIVIQKPNLDLRKIAFQLKTGIKIKTWRLFCTYTIFNTVYKYNPVARYI